MDNNKCQYKCIIQVENKWKDGWDVFISLVLVLSCVLTPLNIAFAYDKKYTAHDVIDHTIDVLFLFDIILCFNAAYITQDQEIVSDRKSIAKNYLTGWFWIDFIAIVPFEEIMTSNKFNKLTRVLRVARMSKLLKLTKMFRIMKIF